jgi:hypothetical protein
MFQLQAKQLADADMPPRTQTQDLLRHVVAARVRQEHVQVWIFDRAHGFVAHPAGLAWFAEKREELSIGARTMHEEEAHVRNSDVLGMPAGDFDEMGACQTRAASTGRTIAGRDFAH